MSAEPEQITSGLYGALTYHHARLETSGRHVLTTLQLEGPVAAQATFRTFERELHGHFEAEETWVFPPFARVKAEACNAIRAEHHAIRSAADLAGKSLDAASADESPLHQLLDLLTRNCRREENDLYRFCETALAEEDSRAVLRKIEEAEVGKAE